MLPISKESKESPKVSDDLDSSEFSFAIIGSQFNGKIVDRLIEGALQALERTGTLRQDVRVIRVPGSFELPLATKRLSEQGIFDAIIARMTRQILPKEL